MHRTPPLSAARRDSKRAAALWLVAMALPLLGSGCTTATPAGQTRHACYDLRGRLESTVATKAECEFRDWEWRERP